ncbi:hypothetical protein Pfo_016344 [Paulownia fortunei]|nr:hypothetical protein Pfo_016344 [Paulownia fortunei]
MRRHQMKQSGVKGMFGRLSFAVIVLVVCTIDVDRLWGTAASGVWRPSSAPRSDWPPPPAETNGYIRVRCNGGLNQQRSAICKAVLAARIMNATLHFIKSLRYDVRIVESIPEIKKIKAFQMRPPRDAPISWYTTDALQKMKEHVNYHALRFKPHIMELSNSIVNRLRAQGHYMAIHIHFEMDMLAFAGCFNIFTAEEQIFLKKYRDDNFAPKKLVYGERRAIGKCPLTPEEVGLILRSMGFDNTTRIYLAAGELFGGERFVKPFRSLFPHLENHNTVDSTGELAKNTRGLVGSAVDYMVCLLSDIFMPTYDGPSDFANNLLGHRLSYGFRTNIQPDRKALAPIFIEREKGHTAGFEESVRRVMLNTNFGGPYKRCFCEMSTANPADKCPPDNVLDILDSQLTTGGIDDSESITSNSTSVQDK